MLIENKKIIFCKVNLEHLNSFSINVAENIKNKPTKTFSNNLVSEIPKNNEKPVNT